MYMILTKVNSFRFGNRCAKICKCVFMYKFRVKMNLAFLILIADAVNEEHEIE